jgi:hypothetical protein
MTEPEGILREITRQAVAMLSRGASPRVVHVGRQQADALARLGHTESTLTVPLPGIGSSSSAREGHAAPERDHLSLLVEWTDAIDQLELARA